MFIRSEEKQLSGTLGLVVRGKFEKSPLVPLFLRGSTSNSPFYKGGIRGIK